MTGEAVAIGIEETTKPIWMAVIPVVFLGLLQLALTWVNMKWPQAENLTQGVDTPLIRDGTILQKNLWRERISRADLMTCLRENGLTKAEDVQEARIEPTGHISVIPKGNVSPLTPQHAGLKSGETLDAVFREEIQALREEVRRLSEHLSREGALKGV